MPCPILCLPTCGDCPFSANYRRPACPASSTETHPIPSRSRSASSTNRLLRLDTQAQMTQLHRELAATSPTPVTPTCACGVSHDSQMISLTTRNPLKCFTTSPFQGVTIVANNCRLSYFITSLRQRATSLSLTLRQAYTVWPGKVKNSSRTVHAHYGNIVPRDVIFTDG